MCFRVNIDVNRAEKRLLILVFLYCVFQGFVGNIDKSQYNKASTKPLIVKYLNYTLLNIYYLNLHGLAKTIYYVLLSWSVTITCSSWEHVWWSQGFSIITYATKGRAPQKKPEESVTTFHIGLPPPQLWPELDEKHFSVFFSF